MGISGSLEFKFNLQSIGISIWSLVIDLYGKCKTIMKEEVSQTRQSTEIQKEMKLIIPPKMTIFKQSYRNKFFYHLWNK